MTEDYDKWGLDPSVRKMRSIFSHMESAQKETLIRLGLSPFDSRLRPAREHARVMFKSAWSDAEEKGIDMEGNGISELYKRVFILSLKRNGIEVPPDFLSDDSRFDHFL